MGFQFSPSGYRKTGGDGFEERVFTGSAATNCTFAMWLRRDVDQDTYGTYWSVQGTNYLALITGSDGNNMRLDSNYESSGLDAQNDPTGFLALVTGTWYYVAITLNGTASTLYYATLGDTTLTVADTWTAGNSTPDFTDTGFGNFAQFGVAGEGSLAFYRSWTSTLSQAQLEAEMASVTPVVTSNLWHDYRFVSGQLDQDSSPNNYDMNFSSGTGGSFTADPELAETITGVADTTVTFAAPAVGTRTVTGTATSDLTFSAPATGTHTVLGTAANTFTFTSPAVGVPEVLGVSVVNVDIVNTATGSRTVPGTVELAVTFNAPAATAPTVNGTASATFTFVTTGLVIPAAVDNIYEIVRNTITTAGFRAYVGETTGDPVEPYAIINADWEPEPDVGQELLGIPSCQRVSMQVNSYGRANQDALWLDATIYTILMAPEAQFEGVSVRWRDADDSPVLVRERYGPILAKHWYRIVYTREGT